MNKLLNIIRVLLTILVASTMFIFGLAAASNWFIIIGLLFLIFWAGTSIMELIRKQNFTLKHNIVSIIVLSLLLIILLRPVLDSILFLKLDNEFILNGIVTLYKGNVFYLWTVCLCLFISNYVDYKIK